jgi:signal transduction histidine kinase
VVAHSLSVVVAQAQAALAAQQRHPERATQAMREVITVSRDSLSEMRRLVGAFGPGPDSDHGLAPQVGISALPALVERVQAARIPVRLALCGAQTSLPAGVDLSAYRIVQEALTNVLKHAGPRASARVLVRYGDDQVEVEVADDGAGEANAETGGHGLLGMRERVTVFGGAFESGPRPDGGFAVRAHLPL